MTVPINESGEALAGFGAGIEPDHGVERLYFAAITGQYYPNIIGCFTALDWGLQDTTHDGFMSTDSWTPRMTGFNATYDDPGVESGTIAFSFSY